MNIEVAQDRLKFVGCNFHWVDIDLSNHLFEPNPKGSVNASPEVLQIFENFSNTCGTFRKIVVPDEYHREVFNNMIKAGMDGI